MIQTQVNVVTLIFIAKRTVPYGNISPYKQKKKGGGGGGGGGSDRSGQHSWISLSRGRRTTSREGKR